MPDLSFLKKTRFDVIYSLLGYGIDGRFAEPAERDFAIILELNSLEILKRYLRFLSLSHFSFSGEGSL